MPSCFFISAHGHAAMSVLFFFTPPTSHNKRRTGEKAEDNERSGSQQAVAE